MSKSRSLVVAAVAAALAGVFVARSDDVDAAAGRPAIAASFGPIQVEGTAPAVFFLALRNTGGADAKLALGDKIELRYGTGGGAGDLLGAGRTMTVDPLPTGLVSQ
jgi:hypothetical protein